MVLARLMAAALLAALLAVPARAQGAPEVARGPVAAREIARGAVLTSEDLSYPAGVERDGTSATVGWMARRRIAAGEPLRSPAVTPPDLVRLGQPVQVVWRDGAVELRLTGRAMASGAAGQRVSVRIDTQRRFEGVVVGPALVRLDPPDRSRS